MSEPTDRPPADTDDGEPETREELLARAAAYAASLNVDLPVADLEWEISERARRRAGSCRYDGETITVALTWDAYREFGWTEFRGTIRHELVHAWEFHHFGESGHGDRFRRKARELDAPRHCRSFTEGRLRLACETCDWSVERHRASKPVRRPNDGYRCGDCGDRYRVRHVGTGRTWETPAGYRHAREAIGDDW